LAQSLRGSVHRGKHWRRKERGEQGVGRAGLSCANEPVESWTLLPSFYQDPGRYGFALQCQILASYATMGADGTLISERGPDASLHVFARMLHTSGEITDHNFETLQRVYNATPFVLPQIMVYLERPARTVHGAHRQGAAGAARTL
jgi:deoxyadenosine/deoxycytidine kinase